MRKVTILMLIISFLFICTACTKMEEQKGPYLAKVGKMKIMQADLEREMKNLPDFAQQLFKGSEGKERFLNELVKKELLYQEAIKRGLDKNAEYKHKVEDFKKITLIEQLLEKEIEAKTKLTDEDIKAYYDEHKEDFSPFNKIRLSLIRVKTEEEAKNILEKLKKGEDFAKIAKESSIDTNSAKNGGDLGYFSKGRMAPLFEEAAFKLKKGEVSDIVRTSFGFHIIKKEDHKQAGASSFNDVKYEIEQTVLFQKRDQKIRVLINQLKSKAKIKTNQEILKKFQSSLPPPPMTPPMPAMQGGSVGQ